MLPQTQSERDALFEEFRTRWTLHARPEQLEPPGNWNIWLVMSGRGWGKTRVGAELVRKWVQSGTYGRLNLVARTAADARDTMVGRFCIPARRQTRCEALNVTRFGVMSFRHGNCQMARTGRGPISKWGPGSVNTCGASSPARHGPYGLSAT